jgi:SAM-dependent methyltransferase
MRTTVFMHAHAAHLEAARHFARAAHRLGHEVVIAGDHLNIADVTLVPANGSFGDALKAALPFISTDSVVLQKPDLSYTADSWERLVAPLLRDEADVVVGHRVTRSLADRALERVAEFALDGLRLDASSGQKAARRQALVDTVLGDGADEAQLLVKLAAQLYRFAQVTIDALASRGSLQTLAQARTFARYASTQDDADNSHEGYSTLAKLEARAPNYNAWLGERFKAFAGQRILEIGAGIGTITAHLAAGRQKVIALEVDPFYVRRLQNRFRGQPQVEPHLSDIAVADWQTLRDEHIDTVVMSNVLEHLPDDAQAVQLFARILQAQGRLLIFVPALPALFGSLDEAVGHHRRYTAASLRAVLEHNGFEVEHLEWMNLLGIPGWLLNGMVLRRRVLPALQLRIYDRMAPALASLESRVRLPIGLSLFCVAKKRHTPGHLG